jgi:SNF2 family DNA or RNA helicase
MMDDHFNLSGKMEVLDKLLMGIQKLRGKVLVFSASTQSLDLIENHISTMGLEYSRMDGQTATKNRKGIADNFRSNPNAFVFLLSTRAMGVGTCNCEAAGCVDKDTLVLTGRSRAALVRLIFSGLNLTAANFVIIFDVDWNPASDSQAQGPLERIMHQFYAQLSTPLTRVCFLRRQTVRTESDKIKT